MQARSLKLMARTLPQARVSDADRQAMWRVFRRYYDSVSEETFLRDLSKKSHVILVSDSGDGSLQGFSTLVRFDEVVDGRRVVAIFSGDTIVEKAYWGQSALQEAFYRYIMATKLRYPLVPVYWFLISKGYKTYLLLSRNFPEYWPRHDQATPGWQAKLLDRLAAREFPQAWKSELGLLQFPECAGRLREGVAQIEGQMLDQPDIRFFAQKNPGHSRGDELCCLGRVDVELALSYGWKMLRRLLGLRRARPRLTPGSVRPSLS